MSPVGGASRPFPILPTFWNPLTFIINLLPIYLRKNDMNKIMVAAVLGVLSGCANLKYPGWYDVGIFNSIDGMPCVETGKIEQCSDSKEDCNEWFKKRATLVNSNSAVVRLGPQANSFIGRYYQCKEGNPIHKAPAFNKEAYKTGASMVTGQAFLTQKGGGVHCVGWAEVRSPTFWRHRLLGGASCRLSA
jgi:hypothetical protein